jgi:hypothetical protein
LLHAPYNENVVLAPPPLAPIRRAFRFPAVLQWWHLLSLDAPTIATLWSWSMARALHLRLPWTSSLLLALGTWLFYVADRILDGLPTGIAAGLRERHFFYARNRGRLLAVAIAVSVFLLWLIVTRMNPAVRHEDTALFVAALAYFCLIHLFGRLSGANLERWFPKEAVVALVFAAAVAVPAWSRLPEHQRVRLLPLIAFFALLCWLNCVAIEKWERLPSTAASPHVSTRWTARKLGFVSCCTAVLAVLAALRSFLAGYALPLTALYSACAISAALFLLLDSSPLDRQQLRIAADVALLTPLAFIATLR